MTRQVCLNNAQYDSLTELIEDNLPFKGQKIGWSTSFYFDPADLEKIAKDLPKYRVLAALGEKPSALEKLGMELFVYIFHHETGIWLSTPDDYLPFLKSKEDK